MTLTFLTVKGFAIAKIDPFKGIPIVDPHLYGSAGSHFVASSSALKLNTESTALHGRQHLNHFLLYLELPQSISRENGFVQCYNMGSCGSI